MGHGHQPPPTTPGLRRLLAAGVAPFVLATVVGLVALWPRGGPLEISPTVEFPSELVDGRVQSVTEAPCPGAEFEEQVRRCVEVEVLLTRGEQEGRTVTLPLSDDPSSPPLQAGDEVVLGRTLGAPPELEYYFVDYQRRPPLLILAVIFAAVVVALGRWRGLAALGGFALSLSVIVFFILPALLQGRNPLLTSMVGASAIMLGALYLAHGVNVRTTSAVLGTFVSLAITGALALVFVEAARLTGFTSEEAVILNISAGRLSLKGLLLGGIIIGALGVLDDVTITQASAVWELKAANPTYGFKELYHAGIRIGRDHIASTVNTLLLAYAGASLPLLILFVIADASFGAVVTGELVGEEVVRTLVGSIGLVSSVPITTGLAAAVAARHRPEG